MSEPDDGSGMLDLTPYISTEEILSGLHNVPIKGLVGSLTAQLNRPATRGDLFGVAMAQARMWSVLSSTIARVAAGNPAETKAAVDDLLEAARDHDQRLGTFMGRMLGGREVPMEDHDG